MRRSLTVFLGIGIVVVTGWLLIACQSSAPSFKGTVLDPPQAVTDFTLTDQHGKTFRLSDQRGQVVLLFFGYTFCPDVCPMTLGTWKRVYEALGDAAERVRFVFVTVDPERDTPERLREHLENFNPDFIGLTGTPDELEPVYQQFGVYYEKDTTTKSAAGYLVSHTASAFVVDPDGQWRLRHSFGTPVEDIVHDIKQLLK
jgi:protein SCO1/2